MTEALKTSNIKTVRFILRTIDTEEGRQLQTGIDLYILEPETPVRITRDISVSATSWQNRHNSVGSLDSVIPPRATTLPRSII